MPLKPDLPHILLINPWIHDFAAYDFWAKPMGLLYLASLLRHHGFNVTYIDCLDRFHPQLPPADPYARNGRGPYHKTPIPKPAGLADIPRNYARYGIKPEWFKNDLSGVSQPNLVFVTSLMTYWYPGVKETIDTIRTVWPNTPVILGGIYASLYPDHAKGYCGADAVISGPGEVQLPGIMSGFTGFPMQNADGLAGMDARPVPAFDLQTKVGYIPLLTSTGCPYACDYCASHFLNPTRHCRQPEAILQEIRQWHADYGVADFVLYDDAFLVNAEKHALPFLEMIIQAELPVRFHTPNAIHIREITSKTADLMYKAGFKTLRLGLETGEFSYNRKIDAKVNKAEFESAANHLKKAGFKKDQIGAYLLAGLPGMPIQSVEASIEMVLKNGIKPVLAHYSPVPHTPLWKKAILSSRYDLESDPVYANNAIFPCQKGAFSWQVLSHLKAMASR